MKKFQESKQAYFKSIEKSAIKLRRKPINLKPSQSSRTLKKPTNLMTHDPILQFSIKSYNNHLGGRKRNQSLERNGAEIESLAEAPNYNKSQLDLKVSNIWVSFEAPFDPVYVLKRFSSFLTSFEKSEILTYRSIYYIAPNIQKKEANSFLTNNGFDDERNDYVLVEHDHIAYKYEILEIIGSGTYGRVVKVLDHSDSNIKALKVLKNLPILSVQGKIEIDILEKISQYEQECENIIYLIEHFVFRNHICQVFELLPMNLYEYHKSKHFNPLPLQVIKSISQQILNGIRFYHNLSIIHCDLKPENIMLTQNLNLKIIDFGSACYVNRKLFSYIQSRFYRAPEVILDIGYDEKIDVWSFGCILAELIIGRPLFMALDDIDQIMSMIEVLGMPPSPLIEKSPKKQQINERIKSYFKAQKSPLCRPLKSLSDDTKLVNLIASCLAWDPALRITAQEGIIHDWLNKSLFHGSSLPVLKLENRRFPNAINSSKSPRKVIRIDESCKKLFNYQKTPKKIIKPLLS